MLGVAETIARGSSLKICAVAEGAADLYPPRAYAAVGRGGRGRP